MYSDSPIAELVNSLLLYHDVFGTFYDPLAYFLVFMTLNLNLDQILLISKPAILFHQEQLGIILKLGSMDGLSQASFVTDQINKQVFCTSERQFAYDTSKIDPYILTRFDFNFLDPKLPIMPKNN